jgi:hypothetical protein
MSVIIYQSIRRNIPEDLRNFSTTAMIKPSRFIQKALCLCQRENGSKRSTQYHRDMSSVTAQYDTEISFAISPAFAQPLLKNEILCESFDPVSSPLFNPAQVPRK